MKNKEHIDTDTIEIVKSTPHVIVEIIEYVPNSQLSKTIIRKHGECNSYIVDAGEVGRKTYAFEPLKQSKYE